MRGDVYEVLENQDMEAKVALLQHQIDKLKGKSTDEVDATNEMMMQPETCYICHSYDHHFTRCPSWPLEEDAYED